MFAFGIVSESVGVDLTEPWHRARERASVKHEWLALVMGYGDHSALSAAIAGTRHLSFQRLLRLLREPDGLRFFCFFLLECWKLEAIDVIATLRVMRAEWLTWLITDRLWKLVPVKADVRDARDRRTA